MQNLICTIVAAASVSSVCETMGVTIYIGGTPAEDPDMLRYSDPTCHHSLADALSEEHVEYILTSGGKDWSWEYATCECWEKEYLARLQQKAGGTCRTWKNMRLEAQYQGYGILPVLFKEYGLFGAKMMTWLHYCRFMLVLFLLRPTLGI